MISYLIDKVKRGREKRESKWYDTLGIEDMSDEYVVGNKKLLMRMAYWKIAKGILVIVLVFIGMVYFWDKMFYA